MAKPPVISESELRHMLKVAAVSGTAPIRDVALLYAIFGAGMMVTELASLRVDDYLRDDGRIRVESRVRAEIANNSRERPLFWVNYKVTAAIDAYVEWRLAQRHIITVRKAAFRGLDPESPLFLRENGHPFPLTKRTSSAGVIGYSCDALGDVIRRLHAQAGVDGGHALAARRTFAVRLAQRGYDLKHISVLLGNKSISTTKRLIDSDPVSLSDLAAKAL